MYRNVQFILTLQGDLGIVYLKQNFQCCIAYVFETAETFNNLLWLMLTIQKETKIVALAWVLCPSLSISFDPVGFKQEKGTMHYKMQPAI